MAIAVAHLLQEGAAGKAIAFAHLGPVLSLSISLCTELMHSHSWGGVTPLPRVSVVCQQFPASHIYFDTDGSWTSVVIRSVPPSLQRQTGGGS